MVKNNTVKRQTFADAHWMSSSEIPLLLFQLRESFPNTVAHFCGLTSVGPTLLSKETERGLLVHL